MAGLIVQNDQEASHCVAIGFVPASGKAAAFTLSERSEVSRQERRQAPFWLADRANPGRPLCRVGTARTIPPLSWQASAHVLNPGFDCWSFQRFLTVSCSQALCLDALTISILNSVTLLLRCSAQLARYQVCETSCISREMAGIFVTMTRFYTRHMEQNLKCHSTRE
jgi:hypothetical protein